ncbi:hypothetical protein PUN28_003691 [Cardiocondyla obscurior]|uniref:ATP synthase F0 subunit 8 n=1 Tax=Cardiocondyla obscurior TaxID=286306 RepID=A0AAW2GJX5_9HYME
MLALKLAFVVLPAILWRILIIWPRKKKALGIPVASSDFEKTAIILINYINFSYGNNCFFWCARFYFSVCFSVARFTLVFKSLYCSHNPVSRLQ